jgi:hypothetical protein
MDVLAIIIVLSLVGLFLILLFYKRKVLFRDINIKRSERNRRKSFIASKNRMRRSGNDRRQSAQSLNYSKAKLKFRGP